MRNERGQFVKGVSPWNRGLSGLKIGTRKGAKFTAEHRKNLSLSHLGARLDRRHPDQESVCQNCLASFTHKSPPSRPRKYCSLDCQRHAFNKSGHIREYPKAELHHNWRGGKAEDRKLDIGRSEYRKWRKTVYERDDYTCQACRCKGGQLNADHIKPWALFPELRYEISNGRTLCVDCHKKTPTYGGRIFSYEKL